LNRDLKALNSFFIIVFSVFSFTLVHVLLDFIIGSFCLALWTRKEELFQDFFDNTMHILQRLWAMTMLAQPLPFLTDLGIAAIEAIYRSTVWTFLWLKYYVSAYFTEEMIYHMW